MKKQSTALRRRRFERIVILVDITIVLLQHEPKKLWAAHIFNSVSSILQQCNEQSKFTTLWGYKFFDPFLHPFASRSKIGQYLHKVEASDKVEASEKFDALAPNLQKFRKVLEAMVNNDKHYSSEGSSKGDYVARAIQEAISNYTWDPLLASDSSSSDEEPLASKERLGGDGVRRDSNAIILFSSVPSTCTGANCFFNSPKLGGDVPSDPSAQGRLARTFRTVREALNSMNIQVCFVDVPMHQGLWADERLETVLKPTAARSLVLKCLSGLVRTVIASELLVVSPASLPFTLVWNTVADLEVGKSSKKSYARILCQGTTLLHEVQLQLLNVVHSPSTSRGSLVPRTKLLPATDTLDIVLESVQLKSSLNMKLPSERFLVRQSVRPKVSFSDEDRDSIGDKLLQLLDQSAFQPGQPGWQLLLLTLASKNSVCEVSLRIDQDRLSLRAVLEPFTSQCAVLTVFEREIMPMKTDGKVTLKTEAKEEAVQGVNPLKRRKDAADYVKHDGVKVIPSRKRRKVTPSDAGAINWQEYWEKEGTTSASTEYTTYYGTALSRFIEGDKASQSLQIMDRFFKERPQPNTVLDLVCPLAIIDVGVEPSAHHACAPPAHPDSIDPVVHPGIVCGQDSEAMPLEFVPVQEVSEILAVVDAEVQEVRNAVADVETAAQEADPTPSLACQMTAEEAKEYIASVAQKVEDYLTSVGVDDRRFAEMLVAESHRSLTVLSRQIEDGEQKSDTGEPAEPDLNRKISVKLKKLLLKNPKGLRAKYKSCVGSICGATTLQKEYELQVLLCLEMISFDEGLLLEQTTKDQLVNDVCKLLDKIQFHLGGGMFGEKSFLSHCDRLLINRYKKKIPSTISKIYTEMELDGYSVLPPRSSAPSTTAKIYTEMELDAFSVVPPPSSAQGRFQETSVKATPVPGDLLLCEAGVSQESISICTSATGGLLSGSSDAKGQGQPSIKGNRQKKKGAYPGHFSEHGYLVRRRKSKSGGSYPSDLSKRSKGCSKQNAPVNDDPVQVVCETPAPMTAPSSIRAGHMPQVATLALPKEFRGCSPKQERLSVEQPPSVVEATPVVRRRLTLHTFGQENPTGSNISLDEVVANIDRTSDAVLNHSAARPSKTNLSSAVPEPWKKSVSSGGSFGRKLHLLRGDISCTELLNRMNLPPRTEVAKLGSHGGSHTFLNKDDDVEDDEDGILSTPYKVNAGGQSVRSLQCVQSARHHRLKRLELAGNKENICP